MKRTVIVILCAALVGLPLACGAQTPQVSPRPGLDSPLDGVVSVCDQFGHRVYLGRVSSGSALAVVPNDPSCIKDVIR